MLKLSLKFANVLYFHLFLKHKLCNLAFEIHLGKIANANKHKFTFKKIIIILLLPNF